MANSLDWTLALLVFWGGAIAGLAIGVTYFIKAADGAEFWLRLLSSAFGPSLALIYAFSVVWWPEQYRYTPVGVLAHALLQLVPLFLLGFSLAMYPGNRRIHRLLVPLGLVAWAWTFALGWLFVHGE